MFMANLYAYISNSSVSVRWGECSYIDSNPLPKSIGFAVRKFSARTKYICDWLRVKTVK
jgi:hypothetical protein